MTSYDELLASGAYEENPEIDAAPVKAFLSRWEKYSYFIERAQQRMYEAIAKRVQNLTVCDIGSGSGFGTLILAQEAASVVGIEIVPDGTKFSQRCYPVKNINFICGDITEFHPSTQFDAAVAIELIEHISDYHGALQAIASLLNETGTLYISSPNRNKESLGQTIPRNRHHVREWTIREFHEILSLYFNRVEFFDHNLESSLNLDSTLSPVIAICHKT